MSCLCLPSPSRFSPILDGADSTLRALCARVCRDYEHTAAFIATGAYHPDDQLNMAPRRSLYHPPVFTGDERRSSSRATQTQMQRLTSRIDAMVTSRQAKAGSQLDHKLKVLTQVCTARWRTVYFGCVQSARACLTDAPLSPQDMKRMRRNMFTTPELADSSDAGLAYPEFFWTVLAVTTGKLNTFACAAVVLANPRPDVPDSPDVEPPSMDGEEPQWMYPAGKAGSGCHTVAALRTLRWMILTGSCVVVAVAACVATDATVIMTPEHQICMATLKTRSRSPSGWQTASTAARLATQTKQLPRSSTCKLFSDVAARRAMT